jgi:hypothetical protein
MTGPLRPSRIAVYATGMSAPPTPGWKISRRRARPLVATSLSSASTLRRIGPDTVSAHDRPTHCDAEGATGCGPDCATLVITPVSSSTSAMSLDRDTKVCASSCAHGARAPRSSALPERWFTLHLLKADGFGAAGRRWRILCPALADAP